ncbi:MAG: glycine cleavage system aminomethyltransferase GcvT [Candidatus Coatesbacteria bacterium]|nr:glycine cleavage system aminomethyltransferase GcvT [Candidatus Coatesbacteria bacterium]
MFSDTINKSDLLFKGLVASFQDIALQGLGKVASHHSGKIEINLDEASYAIDTLTMLQEKTVNNLKEEEARELNSLIHYLRMNYLDVLKENQKDSGNSRNSEDTKPNNTNNTEKKENEMKRTPFYKFHKEMGGKLVPFAGFEMPVQYEGINQEHLHVRNKVGVFDVSHMGEFYIKGEDAEKFVSYITCNNPEELGPHGVQYSAFTMPHSGLVDDLLVYKRSDGFLLVVNAANIDKDWQWVNKQKDGFKVELENISDKTAQLAIQGPLAEPLTEKLTGLKLTEVPFYESRDFKMYGENVLLSRTGYTGEDGFELYFSPEIADKVWSDLFEAGKEFNLKPIGLGARDSLRLEMKYCLYGHDIDETTSPLEAGLGWIVKLDKGDFIGKEVLLKQKDEKPKRKLVCITMLDKAIPRQHYKILSVIKEDIGEVTSGIMSPSLNKGIALGYVKTEYSKIGNKVLIEIRDKHFEAEIVKPPFWKSGSHK